jgi:hypothetical protein
LYNDFTSIAIDNIFISAATPNLILLKEGGETMNIQDDMITMKDGRVMIIRNDGMAPLDDEMTLSDGTRVGMDGTVIMPDGTTRMMEEGETMDLTGEPTHAEQMSDRQFKENMEDEELRDDIQ